MQMRLHQIRDTEKKTCLRDQLVLWDAVCMLLGDSSDSSKGMNHLIMVEDHPKVRGVEPVKLEKTTICSALCFGVLNK